MLRWMSHARRPTEARCFFITQESSLPLPEHTALPNNYMELSTVELLRTINPERRESNLDLTTRVAERIRDPGYSLRQFHDDVHKHTPLNRRAANTILLLDAASSSSQTLSPDTHALTLNLTSG